MRLQSATTFSPMALLKKKQTEALTAHVQSEPLIIKVGSDKVVCEVCGFSQYERKPPYHSTGCAWQRKTYALLGELTGVDFNENQVVVQEKA